MTVTIKKTRKNKKIKVLLIISLVFVLTGTIYFFAQRQNQSSKEQTVATEDRSSTDIDLSPATEEDKKRADENKEKIVQDIETQKSSEPSTNLKKVSPIITYAGQYGDIVEVGGNVNTLEDNGKCIAVFSNSSSSFERQVTAIRDAQSVNCPVISVPVKDFNPKGTWSVVLKYQSTTASGTSEIKNIEVK